MPFHRGAEELVRLCHPAGALSPPSIRTRHPEHHRRGEVAIIVCAPHMTERGGNRKWLATLAVPDARPVCVGPLLTCGVSRSSDTQFPTAMSPVRGYEMGTLRITDRSRDADASPIATNRATLGVSAMEWHW